MEDIKEMKETIWLSNSLLVREDPYDGTHAGHCVDLLVPGQKVAA